MNCYFIKGNDLDKEKNPIFDDLSVQNREKAEEMAKKLANQLKDVKGKVTFFCDRNTSSAEIVLYICKYLSKYKMFSNDSVNIDNRLNSKNQNKFLSSKEYENLGNYNEDAFNFITERIFEGDEQDSIVVVTAGDEFFKTCQKDENIHSLIYFGDEFLIDPKLFRNYNIRGVGDLIINASIDEACFVDTLRSKLKLQNFVPHIIKIEKPKISKYTGMVEPVYLKYAKEKLEKEKNKQTEQSSLGE